MIDGYSVAMWMASRLAIYVAVAFIAGALFFAAAGALALWALL